jgi:hydrogenase expression/formation protein HypC
MCLGIPGEVVDVRDDGGLRIGTVRFAGITRDVCLDYVPDAAVGEYVLVHVGFAISKIDPVEAARTYRVLEELGQTGELTADRELVEPSP